MKNLDFFPNYSSFTIDQNRIFKTPFGGFLTLLSVLICIICASDMGHDFYYKKSPKIYSEDIFQKFDEPYNLTKSDLIIAWRIEDIEGNPNKKNYLCIPKVTIININQMVLISMKLKQ